MREGRFVVTTTGTSDTIAEIGEQLAWLGAALRSSPFESGVAICFPTIRCSSSDHKVSLEETSNVKVLAQISCRISFEIKEPVSNQENDAGHCWHSMFRNPVMVSGYPIALKNRPGLGLEMPLNMIAGLTGSERANEFDGKIFIKGFSAMLIATKLVEDMIIWHYLYNRKGDWISYLDHTVSVIDDIGLSQLDTARHIVGWCSDCEYNAGKYISKSQTRREIGF